MPEKGLALLQRPLSQAVGSLGDASGASAVSEQLRNPRSPLRVDLLMGAGGQW